MKRRRRAVVCALSAVAFAFSAGLLGTATAQAATVTVTPLTLVNGWTGAPFGTAPPSVLITSGIVHFKGAMATSGTNPVAFTLPAAFRPSKNVFIPVDLCNATNGRLDISPSGVASVEAETDFSNAQCFTSLDGAWFAKSASSFTALKLQNGWTNAPFGTTTSGVRNIGGIVHFKGAIATSGTNSVPFTLPAAFRPTTAVYVPVDLCDATNGRLFIEPNGVVSVEAETDFSNAQCFTSLDGASYAKSGQFFTKLTLINGWTNAPFSTSKAQVHGTSGVVHFKGAIATSGTNSAPFKLPKAFRPHKNVFVKVDLCDATNGRLFIRPNGVVTVDTEGSFSNAQCFTSLDGVTFVP